MIDSLPHTTCFPAISLEVEGGQYLEYAPSLKLQPFIKKYYITEGFPQFQNVEIHPVGKETVEMHFHFGRDAFKICDKDSNTYFNKRAYIVGTVPHNQLFTTRFLSKIAILSIEFTHLGVRTLFGYCASEFRMKITDVEDVFGYPAKILLDHLINAHHHEERIFLLDEFFSGLMLRAGTLSSKEQCLYAILDTQNFQSVVEVSELLNVHARSAERHFSTHFGMSPMDFIRISRLNKACEMLSHYPEIRVSEIISNCQYYDQSHFIRDFRELVKMSPLQFLKKVHGLFYFGRGYIH